MKRKTEIANAIIADSEFAYDAYKKYRVAVRELLIKAMDKALAEAADDGKAHPAPSTDGGDE